jgi:hypothetical protein
VGSKIEGKRKRCFAENAKRKRVRKFRKVNIGGAKEVQL